MLGLGKSKDPWNWGAYGKHPVGRDYFRVGTDDPFLRAFSDWAGNGYQKVDHQNKAVSGLNSWRFWARGPKKGNLLCGVGRDSSDGIGRPYPLLIMGTGPLKGWEDHWDLLPLVFEKTWTRIESLATGRFMDLKQLEDDVLNINPPASKWNDLEREIGHAGEFGSSLYDRFKGDMGDVYERIKKLGEQQSALIPLNRGQFDGNFDFLSLLNSLVKKTYGKAVPNSIFMGGIPDKTYLAVFMRPLVSDDFNRLWSAWAEGS